jgi:ATP-dependent Lhr-like helicase
MRHAGESVLLVAPTGGGKTLAGFLPSLIELARAPPAQGVLHTLYISPLKALAVDVRAIWKSRSRRWGLPCASRRAPAIRRRRAASASAIIPPDILLTTPEQLALLLANRDARRMFESVRAVVLDELHALAQQQARRSAGAGSRAAGTLAPGHRRIGLSATVADPGTAAALSRAAAAGWMALRHW